MEHIVTFTGEEFTPLDPDVNQIHIEDIAHSLSLLCRANGHMDYFFSIAQHSINCAYEAKARSYPARLQLACLIHDASEAYLSDITRPVKRYLPEYIEIEKRLQDVIYSKYPGIIETEEDFILIDKIDNDMLIHEFNVLMSKRTKTLELPPLYSTPSFKYREHTEVETEFLKMYYGIIHAGMIQGR